MSNAVVSETNNHSCKFSVIQNVSLTKHTYPIGPCLSSWRSNRYRLLFNRNISSLPENLLARTGLVTVKWNHSTVLGMLVNEPTFVSAFKECEYGSESDWNWRNIEKRVFTDVDGKPLQPQPLWRKWWQVWLRWVYCPDRPHATFCTSGKTLLKRINL